MVVTLQDRLYRKEADVLKSVTEELRASISPNGAAVTSEQIMRERTALAQQLVDHGLGLPEKMRRSVQDALTKARAGEVTNLKEGGEALTSLLAIFTDVLKCIATTGAGVRAAEYPLERVERLPAAVEEMVKLTETTIEEWPWPEDWWPAIDKEMLRRSYEEGKFLSLEEAIRELSQRTHQ